MGISMWQLLIVLLIVVLLFGTKRLKGIGSDLGSAIKGFKKAVTDDDSQTEADAKEHAKTDQQAQAKIVEDTTRTGPADHVVSSGEPVVRGDSASTTEDGQHKP